MLMDERIVMQMRELGFTANEAKAYLALLEHNPTTRYELSKSAGIPRSAIYDVISRLENIGAVSAIYSEPERYVPLPPDDLFSLLEKRFHSSVDGMREQLHSFETSIEPGNTWNIVGYKNLIIKAKELIEEAQSSIYINTWNRELGQLRAELLAAEQRGVRVVVFSFTEVKVPLSKVFSYHIPEKKLERLWQHKIVLIKDFEELLMGEADNKSQRHVAWTRNNAIVSTALDALILDITLYGARFHVDMEEIVADEKMGRDVTLEKLLLEHNPDITTMALGNGAHGYIDI
jgi:sugar-specific transcriptional regulator TrmB